MCEMMDGLTGARQVQVGPGGGQDPGVDPRNHVGLVHDEVQHIMVTGQLSLKTTGDPSDTPLNTYSSKKKKKKTTEVHV